jgi:hypothetical protein
MLLSTQHTVQILFPDFFQLFDAIKDLIRGGKKWNGNNGNKEVTQT